MSGEIGRDDLLYPDLSFRIVGAAYEISNSLGSGLQERTYQRAFANELKNRGIQFKEQVYVPVTYDNKIVGTHYLDFLIENKVIIELKCGDHFSRKNINQVVNYLKVTNLKLAILLNFAREGVKQKRVLNIDGIR